MWPSRYKYHAFISHAVEDRHLTSELCEKLENEGLNIWYSAKKLKPGDSLETTIQKNIAQSRYGVIFFTPTYVNKSWTMKEFNILQAKESAEKRKVILPVLHQISIHELKEKDIIIADKWAIYYEKGIDHVVQALKKEMEIKTPAEWIRENAYALKFWLLWVIVLSAFYYQYSVINDKWPPDKTIESSILQRKKTLLDKITYDHEMLLQAQGAKLVTLDEVRNDHIRFKNFKSYYRNEYEFNNGHQTIRFRKYVGPALNLGLDTVGPHNACTIANPSIYMATRHNNNKIESSNYFFVNTLPVTHEITGQDLLDDGSYVVQVSYKEYLRHVTVNLSYPLDHESPKKTKLIFKGFAPEEKYIFHKVGSTWKLKTIE
jgi:hypothetical protein